MPEIEFFEAEPPTAPAPPTRRRRVPEISAVLLKIGVALFAIAAGGLALVASIWTLYSIRIIGSDTAGGYGFERVDGWGRAFSVTQTSSGPAFHETRYGIVVVVAAGLLFVAALLAVLSLLAQLTGHSNRLDRIAALLTVFGAVAIATIGTVEYLDVQAKRDDYASLVAQQGGFAGTAHVVLGSGFWSMIAVLVLAVLAAVAAQLASRASRTTGNETLAMPPEYSPSGLEMPVVSQPALNPVAYGASEPMTPPPLWPAPAHWPHPGEAR